MELLINFFNKRVCNLCQHKNFSYYSYGNHKNKLNLRLLKWQIARFFPFAVKLIKPNLEINRRLLFSPLYKISRCNNCGYGIYQKKISSETLLEYYKTFYWAIKGSNSEKKSVNESLFLEDSRALGQYKIVKDFYFNNEITDILEVGAGAALFSRLFRYYNTEVKINVVEPDYGWNEYYKSNSIEKVADFFPFKSTKQYNYIHTSHWLEHVIPEINNIIIELKKLLLPGGFLFIEVPNCDSDFWDLDYGDTPHIHFFTKKSLILLLEKAGFKLVNIGTYGPTIRESFQFFHPVTKTSDPDISLALEVNASVKESIKRENGECIRALFRKS